MEEKKNQQISEDFNFHISLESEESRTDSEYWQKQCSILYNMILHELPVGSIQPLKSESEEGERADFVTIFSILVATGITTKALDRVFDIIELWLKSRPKANVTLKYPDGNIIGEFKDLSKSEALELMEDYHKNLKLDEINS